MFTHITGIGQRDRREKGRNNQPKVYLAVEIILLSLVVFLMSLLKIKFITVISALVAVYVFIVSCIPRYYRAVKRQ
ncbi:MAG TPA: hypothetical protein ENK98_01185 [Epsilonproteobacteria bacterium]|nr:hypothetical protein [Campylobacterota bacterium]